LWANTVAAPDASALDAVHPGAVPPEAVLELADAALAAGAPLDQPAEATLALDRLAGGTGAAAARDGDPGHTQDGQLLVDAGLAVATVGGHRPRHLPGPGDDPPMAGASSGASGGLPTMTVWSSTIPSALSTTWSCNRTRLGG
jgi:hypothetical protein